MTIFWTGEHELVAESNLGEFSCGLESVDAWLHEKSKLAVGHVATTLLRCDDKVAAFFAVKAVIIATDQVPKRYEKYASESGHLSGLLLTQMGVDSGYQGNGAGVEVFKCAVRRAVDVYIESRVPLLLVDAATPRLITFYEKRGMTRTTASSSRLVMSLSAARKSLSR